MPVAYSITHNSLIQHGTIKKRPDADRVKYSLRTTNINRMHDILIDMSLEHTTMTL